MSTFKKCKVVMLPTNQKSRLFKAGGSLHYLSHAVDDGEGWRSPQHLYIISDDEITSKKLLNTNDYYYIRNHYNEWYVGKFNGVSFDFINNDGNFDSNLFVCKKIIATTDVSLGLPQPSQQFIQKYIEEYNKGNVITDVLVEYNDTSKNEFPAFGSPVWLKINPKDNTITIKKVKDSYTREEVIVLCHKHLLMVLMLEGLVPIGKTINNETEEWIEENL